MRNFLACVGFFAIVMSAVAAVFFFGGYYSVSTVANEPALVRWALVQVRTASVDRHANGLLSGMSEDPKTLRIGARSYAEHGCMNCHGGPGVEWAKFSEGLRPDPPDLKEVAKERTPAQLFWVIKNGINMTGMPGFGDMPDEELSSIVAFLKKLPMISDDDFKSWRTAAP